MAASDSLRIPACYFIRKDTPAINKNICNKTRPIASCVYLRILRRFSQHRLYRVPLENCLFHVQLAEFQSADTVKYYFTAAFEAFDTRMRSSYSEAFIYFIYFTLRLFI